jgi:hypothetical protein
MAAAGLTGRRRPRDVSHGKVRFIEDFVVIPLLGQKELPMVGEIHLAPSLGRRIRPNRWASS